MSVTPVFQGSSPSHWLVAQDCSYAARNESRSMPACVRAVRNVEPLMRGMIGQDERRHAAVSVLAAEYEMAAISAES